MVANRFVQFVKNYFQAREKEHIQQLLGIVDLLPEERELAQDDDIMMQLTLAATGIVGFESNGKPIVREGFIYPDLQQVLRSNPSFRGDVTRHLEREFGRNKAQSAIDFAIRQPIQIWEQRINTKDNNQLSP